MAERAQVLVLAVLCSVFASGWLAAEIDHWSERRRLAEAAVTCQTELKAGLDSLREKYRRAISPGEPPLASAR